MNCEYIYILPKLLKTSWPFPVLFEISLKIAIEADFVSTDKRFKFINITRCGETRVNYFLL